MQVESRIEVIDFFWYGCPYCNQSQPPLERWNQACDSLEVTRRDNEKAKLNRAHDINGTPVLVVQGLYLNSGNMATTLDGMIPILEGLIQRIRDTPAT